MANYNKVLLMGNLTRDPDLKYLPSGTPVVEFGLAVNRSWTDQQSGERREATTFVDCKAMGRSADVLNQYMRKGSPIFVEGRLDWRSWEAKDGSGRRSKLDVFVENFQFLGGRRDDSAPGRSDRAPTRAGPAEKTSQEPRTGGPPQQAQAESGSLQDDDVPF